MSPSGLEFGPEQLAIGRYMQLMGEDPMATNTNRLRTDDIVESSALREMMAALTQQAGQAQGAADQAGQAYRGAAAQPMQDTPGEQGGNILQNLFANIGSMATNNPQIAQQAQQSQQAQRQQKAMSREQHLQSLRDEYLEKASVAKEMGHTDVAMKLQIQASKAEQARNNLYKQHADLLQIKAKLSELGIEGQQRLREIEATGEQTRQTNKEKPQFDAAQKAALIKQGRDPNTGRLLSSRALSLVGSLQSGLKARGKTERTAAYNNMLAIYSEPQDKDTSPLIMENRLTALRHPMSLQNGKDDTYFLTQKKVYMKVDGKYVKDPTAEMEARARAKEIVVQHETEFYEP